MTLEGLTAYTNKISDCFGVANEGNDLLYFLQFTSKQLQEFAKQYWAKQSFLGNTEWFKLVTETSFEPLLTVTDAYIFFNEKMFEGLTSPDKDGLLRAITLIIKAMEHNAKNPNLKPGLYKLK